MIDAMRRSEAEESSRLFSPFRFQLLAWGAVVSFGLYAFVAFLSRQFDYHVAATRRPILTVLLLYGLAFAIYLFGISLIKTIPDRRRLVYLIIGSAIAFRGVLLFSVPIQEIDIYRYVWDGAVSTTGVGPFTYSPEQIRTATMDHADLEMRKLLHLLNRQPVLHEILKRVHFAELPTIYPPTSQAVFAVAGFTTPRDASIFGRLVIMKAWIMAFDVATFWIVIKLLKMCGMHRGYLLVYAWCPLLMKEVANSGHLDAIAVFLTTLAVYLVAQMVQSEKTDRSIPQMAKATLAALVLALAVGAKIYPVVIAPLILFVLTKRMGARVVLPAVLFCIASAVIVSPMIPQEVYSGGESESQEYDATQESRETYESEIQFEDEPPALMAAAEESSPSVDPSDGLKAFIQRWEMNDFLFLILVENLKPTAALKQHRIAWFSLTPESFRNRVSQLAVERLHVDPAGASFLVARIILSITFFVVAVLFAWKAAQKGTVTSLLQGSFFTVAWFWLLCPTQNPWYWTWALPFLPFVRNRAWLAMSGLVLLYYLRFYLDYHFPDPGVLGTKYDGARFFDFVVTWIEFAPWFVWLAISSRWRKEKERRHPLSRATNEIATAN